jgi:aminoglycoside phosphotransferase
VCKYNNASDEDKEEKREKQTPRTLLQGLREKQTVRNLVLMENDACVCVKEAG